MNIEIIHQYRMNMTLLKRIVYIIFLVEILTGVYHLILPLNVDLLVLTQTQLFIAGVLMIVLSIIIVSRKLDSHNTKWFILYRIFVLGGILHQHLVGLNTLIPITIITLAIIGDNLMLANWRNIHRTQLFVSHEKLTPELYNAIYHANNYLSHQIQWVVNTLIFLAVISFMSLFILSLLSVIPNFLGLVRPLQYLSLLAFGVMIVIILRFGFPELPKKANEYEIQS